MNNFFCKFLLLTIILIASDCFSQILIIDAQSKEAVPFVEIFTEYGAYLGNADENGIVSLAVIDKIRHINGSSILVLNQMAFEKLALSCKDILSLKTISLQPKSIELNEVLVVPQKGETTIVLTGYYRSYQLKGDQLEYFSDGIIELAYNPNDTKGLNKRLSERSWFNPNIVPESNFIIKMVGPPVPDFKTITDFKEDKKNSIYSLLQSDNNKSLTIVEVLKNDLENVKTIKGLGNKSIINFHKEKFVFQTNNSQNAKVKYLDYYSINKGLKFKCKDCDDFQDYFMQSEIFITNIKYYDTFSKKTYSKFTGSPSNSHFTENYWSGAEKHRLFEPLNEKIKKALLKLTLNPVK